MERKLIYSLGLVFSLLPITPAMAQQHAPVAKTTQGLVSTSPAGIPGHLLRGHAPAPPVHEVLSGAQQGPQSAGGSRGSAPPNDVACDAPVDALAIGGTLDWSGTLAGATIDWAAPAVWQAFTTTECANVTIEWCGSDSISPGIYAPLMTGACDALFDHIFFPISPSTCPDGRPVSIFYGLAPGTYYVLIRDWVGNGGTYAAHVSASACAPPPPNDAICDVMPQALAVGSSISWSGTMVGATDQEGLGMNTVWEAFTLDQCADVTFNWCGSSSDQMAYSFRVISGDCNDPAHWHTWWSAGPTTDCGDGNEVRTWYSLQPGTYYVMIHAGPIDTYTAEVSAVACTPPPPNDNICEVAPVPLAAGSDISWNGTMAGATDQEDLGYNTVWEAFTLSECADVTFNFCGSSSPWFTWQFQLVTGDCNDPDNWNMFYPSFTLTDCGDGSNLLTAYGLQPGTYFGLLSGDVHDTYTVLVSAVSPCTPPPANDHCGDVVPQTLAIGDSLSFSGNLRSATVDGDFGPNFPDEQVPTVWHAFTTTECSNVIVSFCGMDDLSYSDYYALLSPSCPVDSNFIRGSQDWFNCTGTAPTIQFWGLPAGTYYLPVGNFDHVDLPYTMEIQASACGPYCAAWADNAAPYFEKISRVSFAGIDRSSSSGTGYEDFLQDTAHVVRGGSYPITVELSHGYYGDQTLAWIDLNGDFIFQDNEQVLASEVSAGPYSSTITIPMDAALGNTRLRLRMHDAGHPNWANDAPCGMASYGQVEDYTVLIDIGTGLTETAQDRFSVMPNPATEHLAITFVPSAQPVQVCLSDATGRVVLNRAAAGATGPLLLDLAGKAPGIYLVQVRFADGSQAVQRIVRE